MWVAIIGALAIILGPTIGYLVAHKQNKANTSKTSVEAMAIVQDAAVELLAPLREQIAELTVQLEDVRSQAKGLAHDLDRAHRALRENGIPIPAPLHRPN